MQKKRYFSFPIGSVTNYTDNASYPERDCRGENESRFSTLFSLILYSLDKKIWVKSFFSYFVYIYIFFILVDINRYSPRQMKNNRKSSDLLREFREKQIQFWRKREKKLVGVLKSWKQTFDIGIVMFRAIKLNCTDERPLISFERCVNEISETCETVWNAARLLAANSSARSLFGMSRERGARPQLVRDRRFHFDYAALRKLVCAVFQAPHLGNKTN